MNVILAQKGSRAHFSDARSLQRKGLLACLIVDWYLDNGFQHCNQSIFRFLKPLTRALSARSPELSRSKIVSLNLQGLTYRAVTICAGRVGLGYDALLWSDRHFAKKVAKLKLPPHDVFYSFSYAGLEALRAERKRGVFTVVNQIDPGEMEYRLVCEEAKRWPEYAGQIDLAPAGYFERARKEWEISDLVMVNSEWSRQALLDQGVSASKIEIIPLAFEAQPLAAGSVRRLSEGKKLRVLWVGSVIIRKGIQYLLEAAKLLSGAPVEFVIAGPIGINAGAVKNSSTNVTWLGGIPRSQVQELYRSCDLFILPTISDGFAITQLEALACGLPVIVTPNCGRVVEDGKTGYLIRPYSTDAIADAIVQFIRDPGLIEKMRPHCIQRAAAFTVDAYSDKLEGILERHLRRKQGQAG
jgi:hypothetical protein